MMYVYNYICIRYVYMLYYAIRFFTKYLNTRLEGGGTLIASGLELGLQVLEQRRFCFFPRAVLAAAIQLKRSFYWGIYIYILLYGFNIRYMGLILVIWVCLKMLG